MNTPGTDGAIGDGPDDRDLDEGGLDLTPRTTPTSGTRSKPRRRWGAIGFLVLLALGAGFIATRFLGDSTLYYKNADEAVAEKQDLGTNRFRLQGVVVGDPKERSDDQYTRFTVEYGGVPVEVWHDGSEPALFKSGLPVVVEGHWDEAGTHFLSNRLLVKHTEDYEKQDDGNYEEKNPDRTVPDEEQAAS